KPPRTPRHRWRLDPHSDLSRHDSRAICQIVRPGRCRGSLGRPDRGSTSPSGIQPEHHRWIPANRLELRMRADLRRAVAQITIELWRHEYHPADTGRRKGTEIMKRKALALLTATALSVVLALADETGGAAPSRHITLREAVQLALKHNHNVRIAQYGVDEKQHAKEAAKSSYFPSIRNDTSFMRLTDTQLIQIKEGSLSAPGGPAIPPANSIINQGGRSLTTSGTQITQPLTSLLKIKRANEIAEADLTENDVALAVHQVYYSILIARARRSATEARIKAFQDLESERIQQVKFGSALEQESIESRAQSLQSKQELLSTD